MRNRLLDLLALALLAGLAALSLRPGAPPTPSPPPAPLPAPAPPPRPWGDRPAPVGALIAGPRHPDGTEVHCDLPAELHVRNRGGRDGKGLCVFASLRHSGHWHDEPALVALFEWMFRQPGGGYPAKVDAMIAAYCKEKSLPPPAYLQVEGADLTLLRQACRTGRLPAVTYWSSPTGRYGGARIAHMVSLLAAGAGPGPDGKGWWVILDNNHPGPDQLEWMSEAQFRRTFTGGGAGWAVILLRPGPPPVPRNLSPVTRGPMLPPCTAALLTLPPPPAEVSNFGIDPAKLAPGERYTLNGRAATRAQATLALAAPALPDDAALRRLTVIGPADLRARVLSDLASSPALAPWRGKLVVTAHDPAAWPVARVGFVTTGRPTLYVQDAAGRVLHRQDDYDDGPDGLATALRRIDPNYRPEADIDWRRAPDAPAPLSLLSVPWSAWALLGAAILTYLFGGKKT